MMDQFRDGYKVSSKMLDVWMVQMRLAQKLIEVCRKHKLRIWAIGGTLLGTVRHKGYIPWDDDIDMAMPRKDYDALVLLAKDEFKDPFFLQNCYTDKCYPRGHSQLRMRGTAAILLRNVFAKFDQSIFIDIFVLDDVPEKEEDQRVFETKLSHTKKLLEDRVWLRWKLTKNPSYYFRMLHLSLYFTVHNFKLVFSNYEDILRSSQSNNARSFGLISYWYKNQLIWGKEWFRETAWLPFEDFKMPVPIDYDKVLSKQYGPSYMSPAHVPTDHGEYAVLDVTKSYKDYLPMLRKRARKNQIRQFFKKLGFE